MKSFLLTPRMSPELRERVLSSLKHDALARAGGANRRRGSFLLRALLIGVLSALGWLLVTTYRQAEREFSGDKSRLIAKFETQTNALGTNFLERFTFLQEFSSHALEPYQGDYLAPRLRRDFPRSLERSLAGTMIYLRGPQRGFRNSAQRVTRMRETKPDSLPRCLAVPPASVDETALLRHLGVVYEPRLFRDRFVNLERVVEAYEFLTSSFEDRFRTTDSARFLPLLDAELRRAELSHVTNFSRARSLLFVIDEPKGRGVVADFDGEAEHFVRVELFDFESGATLLRLRRLVDPGWISEDSRLTYSRELDSCRLASELRAELSQTP